MGEHEIKFEILRYKKGITGVKLSAKNNSSREDEYFCEFFSINFRRGRAFIKIKRGKIYFDNSYDERPRICCFKINKDEEKELRKFFNSKKKSRVMRASPYYSVAFKIVLENNPP